jgi:hypothetical protein
MQDLPIWFEPGTPDPGPTPDPNPDSDCYKLTDKEWELIQFLRNQAQEAGWRDEAQQRDWITLIMKWLPVLLELINDIKNNK